ncbi:hypothetical protein [Bacillus toyonensis]|uniref:hypothetical protein n=1 Tax=Bacillus toyonensis TaxID=155322 RepID=UPI00115574DA|nr:hypothetical protein [Bacillus toyonensis]
MIKLTKMNFSGIHKLTNVRNFSKIGELEKDYLNASFTFAYNMSFTEEGHHRRIRSGGEKSRRNAQIFCDTFNGKLGEFAVYQYFLSYGIVLDEPDVNIMGEGEWDNYDFELRGMKIGVKTTKSIGNLLLIETKDWNEKGQYIPNIKSGNSHYDYIILVRINTTVIQEMKKEKKYYNDEVTWEDLKSIVQKSLCGFDFAGYADREMLIKSINEGNIISQGHYLQSKLTQMDAENYYIQSGDLYDIGKLIESIK